MKFDVPFTYISILLVYIFIIVLLYLPETEVMGFLSLFFWYFFAHIFLFSDLFKDDRYNQGWLLLIISLLLFCSLFFMIFYFINYINAQNNVNQKTNPEIIELTGMYKIFFIVCEFVILLLMAYVKFFGFFKQNNAGFDFKPITTYWSLYLAFIGVFMIFFWFTDSNTTLKVALPFAAISFIMMQLFSVTFEQPQKPPSSGGGHVNDQERQSVINENNKLFLVKGYNGLLPIYNFFNAIFYPIFMLFSPLFTGFLSRVSSKSFQKQIVNIIPFIFVCGTMCMSTYAMTISAYIFDNYSMKFI